jgi:hypothetical protein
MEVNMKKKLQSLWNMGDGGWIEEREDDGVYLCSSYTSMKGPHAGQRTHSTERKLSDMEYHEILQTEAEYVSAQESARNTEATKKDEKRKRIAAYMAVSPFLFSGETHEINNRGEILWDGNFVCFVPNEYPASSSEAQKLLTAAIAAAIERGME